MLPQNKPDRIRILFDDHRLVANAGLRASAAQRQISGRTSKAKLGLPS